MEEELKDTEAYKRMLEEDDGTKLLQFLIGMNDVKAKPVAGTVTSGSISEVAKEQEELEKMMLKLERNFKEKQKEWEREAGGDNQNLYTRLGLNEH
jgi:hypothetical protein